MSDKLVKLSINGKALEVAPGTTVFNAAAEAGIFIPHYCYHPDLSIAGVCRMCMVDIEKNPRLQISCNTVATEGMVVKTDTEKVKETVKNVLELHLINHPIDCPICDKAGECKLQDFYAGYGLYASRMDYEKVHKPKVVDIGTIMLDSERCILCSRCVRFTAEVTKTNELGIFNRGDRSELRTFDHGPLRNDYTGNLADICPVGALTAKDFRFKQRVWFLDSVSSVCTLCAKGCNTKVSKNPNTQKLFRVEPRRNTEVNKSWICDRGRWEFHYVHDENRLTTPRQKVGNDWVEQTWHQAFLQLKQEVESAPQAVLVALSTQMTNEEMIDAVQSFSLLGVTQFTWMVDEKVVNDKKPYDGILKHLDSTANAAGFEAVMKLLGKTWIRHSEALTKLTSGKVQRLLVLGLEGYVMPGLPELLLKVPATTKIALHLTSKVPMLEKCDWILPAVSSYEKSGTVINANGRLQRLKASVPEQFISRNVHEVVHGLSQGSDRVPADKNKAESIFEEFVRAKWLKGEKLGAKGQVLSGVN